MPPSGSHSVWSCGLVIVGSRTNFRIDLRNTSDKIGQIVYESDGERQRGQMDSLFKTLPNAGDQLTKGLAQFRPRALHDRTRPDYTWTDADVRRL
jgi:cytochrome d ubiquinol oxidase subunit I